MRLIKPLVYFTVSLVVFTGYAVIRPIEAQHATLADGIISEVGRTTPRSPVAVGVMNGAAEQTRTTSIGPAYREVSSAPLRTRSSLARRVAVLLDYDASSCEFNCELSPCRGVGGGHQNVPTEHGNDKGGPHEYCIREGCSFHSCGGPGLSAADLDTLVDLIPQLPGRDLAELAASEPNLLVVAKRSMVQVLGCEGLVLASLELTSGQAVGVGSEYDPTRSVGHPW